MQPNLPMNTQPGTEPTVLQTPTQLFEACTQLPPAEKAALLKVVGALEKRLHNAEEQIHRLQEDETGKAVLLAHAKRELQIEAALENVRTRAMAMHNSEELKEVVKTLFEELTRVDVSLHRCMIWTPDPATLDARVWILNPETMEGDSVLLPYNEDPFYQALLTGWKERDLNWNYTLEGEPYKQWVDFFCNHTEFSRMPELVKASILSLQKAIFWAANYDYGAIQVASVDTFPEENLAILGRFSKVFDMSYTRFLDLQRAEAQARGAQIEASLERIRSRSMAMQKSEELKEVIQVIFDQLRNLHFPIDSASFVVEIDETNDLRNWIAASGQQYAKRVDIPYFDHPIFHRLTEAKDKGETFYSLLVTKEEKDRFFDHFFNYAPTVAERKAFIYESNGWIQSSVLMGTIGLSIINYACILYSEEQNSTLVRFGKAFEQAYTRYLDLQQAEAQAREAQIELSLEKVRVKTMAMKHHHDLLEVTNVLFEQLQHLGFDLDTVNFSANGLSYGDWDIWITSPVSEAAKLTVRVLIPWFDHPYFQKARKGLDDYFRDGTDLNVAVFKKEEKDAFLDHLFLHTAYKEMVPEEARAFIYDKPGYTFSTIALQETWISIGKYNTQPFTDEQHTILKRFAVAFGQTFTRFLDLQKAEASSREAVRQASIDRVRAEIASMRTTQDLERITPLIWRELTTLDVPFIRCGVFIMDEAKQKIHTFLSEPDGKAIAAFQLSYHTPGNVSTIIDHWRKKAVYADRWDEQTFTFFAKSLVEQGAIASSEEYLKTLPEGGFFLQFFPFPQGMLYVGTLTRLQEEEKKVVQSLADAFSSAYARYEDFNKLENAKRKIEKTLSELKSAQAQLVQAEKMASLGELTAGIAHEIQNPLNFINNFAEVNAELIDEMQEALQKGSPAEAVQLGNELKENELKVLHHGRRADAIVKSMLQHSRLFAGEKQLTDINSLTDEYLRLSYHGMRAKDKSFTAVVDTQYDEKVDKLSIMPQEIGRVLLNLFNNAFYAVQEKKKQWNGTFAPVVSVRTKKEDGQVVITVKDNGAGMSQKVAEKIFQPFFTTKPTGEGTGLGLSLSYDIITKGHGGALTAESREGEGAVFVVRLPVR